MAGEAAMRSGWEDGWMFVAGPNPACGTDSGRVSVVPGDQVVKDQGGELLTAVGRGGGTEDRMGFDGLRHYVFGGGNG